MSLGEVGINGIDQETAIALLVELIETTKDENIRTQAAEFLARINPGNEIALSTLVELTENAEYHDIRMEAAEYLENIDPGNETAISNLIELVQSGEDGITRMTALEKLGNISVGSENVIAFLLNLFQSTENEYIRQEAVGKLRQILRGIRFPKVVTILKNYLPLTDQVEPIEFYCEEAIWHCAQNMRYQDFYRAWYSEHLSGQG